MPASTPSFLTKFLVALLLLCFFGSTDAFAQRDVCEGALAAAKKDYQRGFFDEASFRLSSCLSRGAFSGETEKAAYLLLGQIYHANLEEEKARDSVRILLEQDPSLELNPQEYKSEFIDFVDEVIQDMQTQANKPVSRRKGFWFSAGLGGGEGSIQCDCPLGINLALDDNDPWKGGQAGSFYLAAGGTVSPKLQIGGELNSWARSSDANDRTSSIALLSFVAKYYPNETGNFYLKGGIGFGNATLENNVVKLQAGGAGMQFGLGYDILLGQNKTVAISPFLNLNVLYANEDVVVLDTGNDNFVRLRGPTEPSYVQLGIAFTVL